MTMVVPWNDAREARHRANMSAPARPSPKMTFSACVAGAHVVLADGPLELTVGHVGLDRGVSSWSP